MTETRGVEVRRRRGVYRGDMSKYDQELSDRDQGGGGKVRDGETNPVPVFTSLYHSHV